MSVTNELKKAKDMQEAEDLIVKEVMTTFEQESKWVTVIDTATGKETRHLLRKYEGGLWAMEDPNKIPDNYLAKDPYNVEEAEEFYESMGIPYAVVADADGAPKVLRKKDWEKVDTFTIEHPETHEILRFKSFGSWASAMMNLHGWNPGDMDAWTISPTRVDKEAGQGTSAYEVVGELTIKNHHS